MGKKGKVSPGALEPVGLMEFRNGRFADGEDGTSRAEAAPAAEVRSRQISSGSATSALDSGDASPRNSGGSLDNAAALKSLDRDVEDQSQLPMLPMSPSPLSAKDKEDSSPSRNEGSGLGRHLTMTGGVRRKSMITQKRSSLRVKRPSPVAVVDENSEADARSLSPTPNCVNSVMRSGSLEAIDEGEEGDRSKRESDRADEEEDGGPTEEPGKNAPFSRGRGVLVEDLMAPTGRIQRVPSDGVIGNIAETGQIRRNARPLPSVIVSSPPAREMSDFAMDSPKEVLRQRMFMSMQRQENELDSSPSKGSSLPPVTPPPNGSFLPGDGRGDTSEKSLEKGSPSSEQSSQRRRRRSQLRKRFSKDEKTDSTSESSDVGNDSGVSPSPVDVNRGRALTSSEKEKSLGRKTSGMNLSVNQRLSLGLQVDCNDEDLFVARRTRSPSTAVAMRRIRAAADAITQKQKDEEKETEAAAEAAKESEEKEKARRKQAAQTRWEKLRKYVKNGALLARLFRVDPFALMRAKSKNRQSRQLLIDPSIALTFNTSQTSLFYSIWRIYLFLLVVYAAVSPPLIVAFELSTPRYLPLLWFNIFIDICFILNFYFNFITAKVSEAGDLVLDKRELTRRYVSQKGRLAVDVLATLPLSFIYIVDAYVIAHLAGENNLLFAEASSSVEGGAALDLNADASVLAYDYERVSIFLRLLPLLKLLNLRIVAKMLGERTSLNFPSAHARARLAGRITEVFGSISPSVRRLIRLCFWMLLAAHWVACLRFYMATHCVTNRGLRYGGVCFSNWVLANGLVAVADEDLCATSLSTLTTQEVLFSTANTAARSPPSVSSSFFRSSTSSSSSSSTASFFEEDCIDGGFSVVINQGIMWRTSTFDRYAHAFNWALLSMTDFGTSVGEGTSEVLLSTVATLIGISLFATVIGNVGSILSNLDEQAVQMRKKMERIDRYMSFRRLGAPLRFRVRQFYEFQWNRSKGFDENDILEELPPSLRMQVLISINALFLRSIPWLRPEMERNTLIDELCAVLVAAVVPPGEYFFVKGQRATEMVLLVKGEVRLLTVHGPRVVRDGASLGEVAVLFGTRHRETALALTFCDVFLLSKDSLAENVSRYGDDMMDKLRVRALELIRNNSPKEYDAIMNGIEKTRLRSNSVASDAVDGFADAKERPMTTTSLLAKRRGSTDFRSVSPRPNGSSIPFSFDGSDRGSFARLEIETEKGEGLSATEERHERDGDGGERRQSTADSNEREEEGDSRLRKTKSDGIAANGAGNREKDGSLGPRNSS